ncbi:hypothetical protein JL37_07980 [Achromobacter sp. RTa]|uniref:YbjN domain-containing protein n=1 Tax=Achromobacter sp. RTa TaxID=1532557 RepID=UPI00050DEE65|nr:YbjN domain-containing protein [Achromobacter sp. RTa]KGD96777.1 hypothetical protein JL37_07980 [Achromobacter sp. RTa]
MTDSTTLIQIVTADSLTALLQDAGLRVSRSDQNGSVQLLSASQGAGFSVRFGNPGPKEGEFVDYTFRCALRVQGELPDDLVGSWNVGKRFACLTVQGGSFLVLEMDVVVAGGVSQDHVRAKIELWDRLLQEFLMFLRQYVRQEGGQQPEAAETAAQEEGGATSHAAQETVA